MLSQIGKKRTILPCNSSDLLSKGAQILVLTQRRVLSHLLEHFFTNKRIAWEKPQKCLLSEILLNEAWRESPFQQWLKGGVKGQLCLCNNEERETQGRKTVEEMVGPQLLFFPL